MSLIAPMHNLSRRCVCLLGLLAIVPVSGCAVNVRRSEIRHDLRILVYNIHAGKDRGGADNINGVARMIVDSAIDIALLQEVDSVTERSARTDQLAELRRLTGFHGAFGRTLDYQDGGYGIAVLSRFPIASDSVMPLPVTPRQERAGASYEPRGVLHATILIGVDTLNVLNTHLDASSNDSYRRQEAAALAGISLALTKRDALVMVGGDLNSTPESPIHAIAQSGGVQDVWMTCGSGHGFSFPEIRPIKRIDYLLVSARIRCEKAKVLESRISDHLPILFRVSLPSSR